MTNKKEVYRCNICGNIVEVFHAGVGILVCCGQPMELLKENTIDASIEKHVPVIEKTEHGVKVKIGSSKHPMTQEHYIEWIELMADGKSYIEFLKPGMEPEAEFCVSFENMTARAYCNLHKLWKS